MNENYSEELYSRSRTLFMDLLKLGLTLSTGMIAALGFIVFNTKDLHLHSTQKNYYYVCLIALLLAVAMALLGWFAQAMYYTGWATDLFDGKTRRFKWRILRNFGIGCFIILFCIGVLSAALFINSYLNLLS